MGSGEAKLEADGKIKVEVEGFVLNDASTGEFNDTPDGVTDVVTTVICGGNSEPRQNAQAQQCWGSSLTPTYGRGF